MDMNLQELQSRAEELLSKDATTSEEVSELESLTEQITKAGNELAAANDTNVKKTALANALASTKGLSDSVPQANRPVYAQSSETSRTTHKAEVVMSGLKIRRADFTVKEISEETYASLKADGYSDNVIGLATTDQFAKEFVLERALAAKKINIVIDQRTKGESDIAVAAASPDWSPSSIAWASS